MFLEDLSGTNVDSVASLLEGCGRYLLRGAETGEKTAAMASILSEVNPLYLTCPTLAGTHEAKTKPATL